MPLPCERGHERGDTEQQIQHSAEVPDTEPHDDDADVVKSALEKICGHWSLVNRARLPGRASGGTRAIVTALCIVRLLCP